MRFYLSDCIGTLWRNFRSIVFNAARRNRYLSANDWFCFEYRFPLSLCRYVILLSLPLTGLAAQFVLSVGFDQPIRCG